MSAPVPIPAETPPAQRHRRWYVLRGDAAETAAQAASLLSLHEPDRILWVSDEQAPSPFGDAVSSREARKRLGSSFDAVVLDLHQDIEANLIGQCHGFVWGGGTFIIRLPPRGEEPANARSRSLVFPCTEAKIKLRFLDRMERFWTEKPAPDSPVEPPRRTVHGTPEQAALVVELSRLLRSPSPQLVVLQADRGRGKSAALGLALRDLSSSLTRTAITAGSETATHEVLRFATSREKNAPTFTPLKEILNAGDSYDAIIVDEAAQLPIPLLQRLVKSQPRAHIVFATTIRGYEGTGRGFVLRFLEWLQSDDRPLHRFELSAPIRWDASDPLESLVFRSLLLDAKPSEMDAPFENDAVKHVAIDRETLMRDEALLRAYFGLLVHAHYRTTPDDLRRILDGPNLRLHALVQGDAVLAATMVALEGSLPAELSEDLYWGRRRLRGHALTENLCSHLGRPDAGGLKVIRSIRIAVHPSLRRRGLATRLVQAVHDTYQPDLFGTLFGATAGLLQFRRSVGYELVRVGASRGARTGEPSVMMIHPVSAAGEALLGGLRRDLARDLPLQLTLMEAGRELDLDPELRRSLMANLPPADALTDNEVLRQVMAYAFGSRTQESVCVALHDFVTRHQHHLTELQPVEARLIAVRLQRARSWEDTREDTGLPSIPATMRAMRRALRALFTRATPEHIPPGIPPP